MKTRILAGFVAIAIGWLAVRAATPGADGPGLPSIPAVAGLQQPFGLETPAGKYSAVTNCSASNCHGNGSKGNEYAIWAGDDPHRKAHLVLFNDVSDRIQKNLKTAVPASQDPLCLKCHAVDHDKHYHGELLPGRGLSEGVSCDACHGPSQAWLGEHYRDDWKRLTDREKYERYGFKQTKDLVARALMCAQCHVGGRDREVNHGLIAAGHPRLAFEAARFHFTNNYPKHWKERIPNPEFEMKLWAIGQVASLRQAMELLAARAERAAANTAPWPEFAEASCFSCHFAVPTTNDRSAAGDRGGRPSGRPAWQLWYTAVVGPKSALTLDRESLTKVRTLQSKDSAPPAEIATAAKAAVADLDAWLATVQRGDRSQTLAVTDMTGLARFAARLPLTEDGKRLRDTDWDFLAQHTLALAAVAHAAGDAAAEWRPLVAKLQEALAFPSDSGGRRYDSPRDYDAAVVLDLFRKLDQKLNAGGGR